MILQYLADIYSAKEPQLVPHTPELRAKAALAVRFHDLYITTIQGCMYKKMDAKPRAEMLAGLNDQLDVLEEVGSQKAPETC